MHISATDIHILGLMAQGHTNREIAARMHYSPVTVHNHVLHLYDVLGACNRTRAVVAAVTLGLISLDYSGNLRAVPSTKRQGCYELREERNALSA